jgi:hypothetical protein
MAKGLDFRWLIVLANVAVDAGSYAIKNLFATR